MAAIHLERQLLLASFAAAPEAAEAAAPTSAQSLLLAGDYVAALAAALKDVQAFLSLLTAPESPPDWFDAAGPAVQRLLTGGSPSQQAAAAQRLLAAAVAALHLFLQANLSGPIPFLPECPFDLDGAAAAAGGGQDAAACPTSSSGFGRDSASPGDRWAAAQLSESGEDLVGRIHFPQYLLLARIVLLAPLEVALPAAGDNGAPPAAGAPCSVAAAPGAAWLSAQRLPGWCWWAQRAVLQQQRLLSGRSAALRSLLLGLGGRVLAGLAAPVEDALGEEAAAAAAPPTLEDQLLAAGALLEAALLEEAFGHVEAAQRFLQRGGGVLGFNAELTGALGVRTVHQQQATAQLVVSVTRRGGNPWSEAHAAGRLPDGAQPAAALRATADARQELPPDLKGFTPDSDVLRQPRLVEGAGAAPPAGLHSLEQALLLGWSLHVRKGSAADGLQPWEVAAYVDAVSLQERTQFLLHAAAALQAARLEKARSRTRDRALLQMEALADSLDRGCDEVTPEQRLRYAFCTWLPLRPRLRKELGELLVGMGLVGAALGLFEELELWDSLIVCYQLLDKRVQAEELIRRRLEATPDEPRLWCALGDLCMDDAHYQQAWERSGHRNARSQRSLARSALRNSRYAAAARHWEAALALNPLHAEGWFSLGYCCIKGREYERALQAFTRSSQLEPDNGEAWNNLAAIHMHLHRWRNAYNALSEAVKHKRDSWQTWENYAQVAVRVGQWQTAVRAMQQVLALSAGQRLDLSVVAALVGQVESTRGSDADHHGGGDTAETEQQAGSGVPQSFSDAAPAAEGVAPTAAAEGGDDLADLAAALGELSTSSAAQEAAPDEAVARAQARAQHVLAQAVGALLKQAAATASSESGFWELYARYQTAVGYPDAAKECLLKRVRALGGSAWQASPDAFQTYAEASAALCRAYLQAAEAGPSGQRDLASARLHLRGLLKQARERYEDQPAFKQAEQLLEQVELVLQQRQA